MSNDKPRTAEEYHAQRKCSVCKFKPCPCGAGMEALSAFSAGFAAGAAAQMDSDREYIRTHSDPLPRRLRVLPLVEEDS